MAQSTDYPEPDQLRFYAEEPAPFHPIHETDVDLLDSGYVRAVHGDDPDGKVGYLFAPAYINRNTSDDEWVRIDMDGDEPIGFDAAWDRAFDVEPGEDFLCATGPMPATDDPEMYEAFWILDRVIIGAPRP